MDEKIIYNQIEISQFDPELNKENIKKFDAPISEEVVIPNATIKDIDQAIFNFFDKRLNINITIDDKNTKVPVLFANGERWAQVKKKAPIRDEAGRLILPLITVLRSDIDRSMGSMGGVRGDMGPILIKREISNESSNYKNLFKNGNSRRVKGKQYFNGTIYNGKLLKNNSARPNIIYDMYYMDFPDFFETTYEVIIWTQYIGQNNSILEKIFKSFEWKNSVWLECEKGYKYAAVFSDAVTPQSNLDDFSDSERIIKSQLTITVSSYIFGSNSLEKNVIKKITNAPQVVFQTYTDQHEIEDKKDEEIDRVEELDNMNYMHNIKYKSKNKRRKRITERICRFDDTEELEKFFSNH